MADLGNLIELVKVPEGKFMMGSPDDEAERCDDERPQHKVAVSAFEMGKYPITQEQWKKVAVLPQVGIDLNPDPSTFKGGCRPVENISWHQAVEFCRRLNQATGKNYRLPSEAEWEYACRAGTTTAFNCGHSLDGKACFDAEGTEEVGHYPPNAFDLYDMHGNVFEWCQDCWHESYDDAPTDGSAWLEGGDEARIIRGGSWYSYPRLCRSAYRYHDIPDSRFNYIGFRVILAPDD